MRLTTDLNEFLAILDGSNIEHSVTGRADEAPTDTGRIDISVWLEVGGGNVDGHAGFFARFMFDDNGRLNSVVIAE